MNAGRVLTVVLESMEGDKKGIDVSADSEFKDGAPPQYVKHANIIFEYRTYDHRGYEFFYREIVPHRI